MKLSGLSAHGRGLLLGVCGVLILSPDALILRLLAAGGADHAAVIAGRAGWVALAAAALCLAPWARRDFRWRPILLYALFFAASMSFFPLSIELTYAANTLVLLATTPLLAALGARIFLAERVAWQTWAAAVAAGAGASVLLLGGDGAGGRFLGDLFGLLTAVCLAGGAIVIRGSGGTAMFPSIAIGALAVALGWGGFAVWDSVFEARLMSLLFIDGAIVLGLSFMLIAAAAKHLSPPETGLIFLLETAFGPLWVWLVLAERPPASTLLAGGLIAAVLILHSVWALVAAEPPNG